MVPGVLKSPALPLSPREGVASGRPAAVSASLIACDSGMPAGVPVASSTMMVCSPLRSVWSNISVGPSLPMAAVLKALLAGGEEDGVLVDEVAGEMRVDVAEHRIVLDERRHAAAGRRHGDSR